ncbi:RecQ family ATP-dependent DNA helicase [Candidatus Poriferisodalis sp.]|uniref:RecQ family ATP-dependent DNA helicase n=1 Tax=Candidatus Poriferisodalis sp. TaxID=3101277 RepID=UPI003D13DA61
MSAPLVEYVRDRTGVTRAQAVRYGASHRIVRGADRHHATYRSALDAAGVLRDALRHIADALDAIHIPSSLSGRSRSDALEEEKARLGGEARNSAELVDAVLWAETQLRLIDDDLDEDADLKLWVNVAEVRFVGPDTAVSRTAHGQPETQDVTSDRDTHAVARGQWQWELRRAPVSVAGLLADVWEISSSVVLTSATLAVDDDFSFVGNRLGFSGTEAKSIPSPFTDIAQRHLVLLTDYLPSPRGQLIDRFAETEAAEIPRLCVASDGGAMVLMTARARLEYVRDHARGHLAPLGIELLAQDAEAGSAAALIDRMKKDLSACLLGLRSFWEGVDIQGDALRQLIIEKIPFDPIGEPLVNARMDLLELQGRDPFAHYLVPRAAIALAQGTGRLIRSATDRGVTVILDNRMRRPLDYADKMRRSLAGPPAIRPVDAPHEAYRAIAEHLGFAYDDARRSRIDQIPGVETLSKAALDVGDPEAPLDDADIERRLEIARRWLGFDEWRPGQREVMTRFMRGEDVVAVLPTGSGKSVTYQIPALVSPGVTVVVSPLVALMRDQVDNLRARGVNEAAAIHTGISQAEQQAVLHAAAQGHIKLLYVSPERLWSPAFLNMLRVIEVARVAVDEAHCISLWGHSFRPEYASIPRALEAAVGGRLPVVAVTATATPDVLDDIAELLRMAPVGGPLVGSVDRPEIRYFVETCRNRRDRDVRVAQIVEAFRRRSAIVYVPTRNDTVRLAALLRTFGHRVRPYSGAMELTERQHTEDAFRHDEIDVVVATKAFGLGIDKPDIALIVHLEMPASIEEYVQETGRLARGSRDGSGPETGTAVLLMMPGDCRIHEHFVRSSAPDLEVVRQVWSELSDGVNFIDPDRRAARTGNEDGERDESAMLALHYLEQIGAVRRHRDFVLRGRLMATEAAAQILEELRADDADFAAMAEQILTLAEQEGGDYRGLRWRTLLEMVPSDIEEVAHELQHRGACSFTSWRYGWAFERVEPSAPDWHRLSKLIEERRRTVALRAREAHELAHGRPVCRRRDMLSYLGEPDRLHDVVASCGACDACTPGLPRPWIDSEIVFDDAAEAVRANASAVALVLIYGSEGGQWSRRNLVRALRGQSGGKYPLHEMLRVNGCFGRLALLSDREVDDLFDGLIADGCLEQYTPEGRDYSSLHLTSEGRRLATGGPRV